LLSGFPEVFRQSQYPTFANRSFWTAATSSGFVVNQTVKNWLEGNTAETIFKRLEQPPVPQQHHLTIDGLPADPPPRSLPSRPCTSCMADRYGPGHRGGPELAYR
jgi:hypothetical protein